MASNKDLPAAVGFCSHALFPYPDLNDGGRERPGEDDESCLDNRVREITPEVSTMVEP
jgi:hypothetical protein